MRKQINNTNSATQIKGAIGQLKQEAAKGPLGYRVKQPPVLFRNICCSVLITNFDETFNGPYVLIVSRYQKLFVFYFNSNNKFCKFSGTKFHIVYTLIFKIVL